MIKILSIDGGGIRGVIPARILAAIEKETGKPISEIFDLIAGTSTGGILSLGLCRPGKNGKPKFSAADMEKLYAERGGEIFSRSFWKGVSSVVGLADERYPHEPIEKIFSEFFGNTLLKDALTHVLISSYDIENRAPFFFKSWREETNTVKMKHIARATSAAPTYFEPARIPIKGKNRALIDGGVFANNPGMCAYAEARRIFPDDNDILFVSLGAGELTRPIKYEDAKGWGLISWTLPILSVVFDGVSDTVDYQLKRLLGNNFHRFQTRLDVASDDLDNASRANILALMTEADQIVAENAKPLMELCKTLAEN